MEKGLPGLGGNMLTLKRLSKVFLELESVGKSVLTVKIRSKTINTESKMILQLETKRVLSKSKYSLLFWIIKKCLIG